MYSSISSFFFAKKFLVCPVFVLHHCVFESFPSFLCCLTDSLKNALSECVTFLFHIIISSKASTFAKKLLPPAASYSHIYKPA